MAEQAAGKEWLHKNGRLKKPIGRPRVTAEVELKVQELRGNEWGVNRIARELGIGSGTVRCAGSLLSDYSGAAFRGPVTRGPSISERGPAISVSLAKQMGFGRPW